MFLNGVWVMLKCLWLSKCIVSKDKLYVVYHTVCWKTRLLGQVFRYYVRRILSSSIIWYSDLITFYVPYIHTTHIAFSITYLGEFYLLCKAGDEKSAKNSIFLHIFAPKSKIDLHKHFVVIAYFYALVSLVKKIHHKSTTYFRRKSIEL